MPLKKCSSKKCIEDNMKQLKKDGYPQKQRVAIVLNISGKNNGVAKKAFSKKKV